MFNKLYVADVLLFILKLITYTFMYTRSAYTCFTNVSTHTQPRKGNSYRLCLLHNCMYM